jgi:tRNA-dihydrouridine synthase B
MGADVIDINMGCPAKKVLQKAAGSALLRDRDLVQQILQAVVGAVDVPVTLKIRTGWSRESRNGVDIALIAQDAGIHMLAVHGRTRECRFMGEAEYDTIAAIKQAVSIPVIANGDIVDAVKAERVLRHTGADGLMIGRAAQGRPWIFQEIDHYLSTGTHLAEKRLQDIEEILLRHTRHLHAFYGDATGLLFARKHLSWYSKTLPDGNCFKSRFNHLESTHVQIECIQEYFEALRSHKEIAA